MDIENNGQEAAQGGPPPPPPDAAPPPPPDVKPASPPASPPEGAEQNISGPAAVPGGAACAENELSARLEVAESSLAALRSAFDGQRSRLEAELDSMAQKDAVDALRVNLAAALNSLNEMKLNFAQYADELSASRSECRKALGEAQGLAKVAAQSQAAGQMDSFVRDSVTRLGAKLAELETAMHSGLSELAARFNANEVLYNKMFASAEERLKKGVEPQLKSIDGQLRWLRENLLRLSDDYTVVTERKMRALEAKYSAFEAISRRMDSIDAALRMGKKDHSH